MNTDPSRVKVPPWTAHPPAVRSPCGRWARSKAASSRRSPKSPVVAGTRYPTATAVRPSFGLPVARHRFEPCPQPAAPCRGGLYRRRPQSVANVGAREGGYVTLFVLAIAAAIFLALGSALQANSCLRDANRRQAQQLQARAAEITVRP